MKKEAGSLGDAIAVFYFDNCGETMNGVFKIGLFIKLGRTWKKIG